MNNSQSKHTCVCRSPASARQRPTVPAKRQISVRKQASMRGAARRLNPVQKIPNLKAFPRRFLRDSIPYGETMGTAASTFPNPCRRRSSIARRSRLTPEVLARRAKQRRQILGHDRHQLLVDACVLLIYAYAGIIPISVPPGVLASAACDRRASSSCCRKPASATRFSDHYLIAASSHRRTWRSCCAFA